MRLPAPLARSMALSSREASADGLTPGRTRLWKAACLLPWAAGAFLLVLLPLAVASSVRGEFRLLPWLLLVPMASVMAMVLTGMCVFSAGRPPVLSREDYGDGWL